jgi:cell wall-associated NlpC family hydrolase
MRRGRIVGAIALLILAIAVPHAISAGRINTAEQIIEIAKDQIGKDFRMGAEGPDKFDCSGLVYFAFTEAGVYEEMFGTRRFLAREYYQWGLEHDALSTSDPEPGDLVLWTHHGGDRVVHMGIYMGEDTDGRPMVISALTTVGVWIHRLNNISVDFLTYVHTGLNKGASLRATEMGPQRSRPWRGNLKSGNTIGVSSGRERSRASSQASTGDSNGGYVRIGLARPWWQRH